MKKEKLKKLANKAYIVASFIFCIVAWPLSAQLSFTQIQPIASAISTFAGILFGFVLGSITLIASAKDNTLIRNIGKTGYLKKFTEEMHSTMGWLLSVCIIFIILLFFPDVLTFKFPFVSEAQDHTYAQLLLQLGIFVLLITFKKFYITWLRLKDITKLM
jgi:DNA integrity scanning protein DisA with diadenylate cyclase activity